MVNVIDNESRKRANMMPVGIKVVDDKGNAVHTAKTDLGTNYISLESKWFGSSSNNNGGNTDPDNPIDNGVNYVPGLLSDGTLTGRKLEWTGTTDSTKVNTLSFKDDLGSSLNLAGDGLQFVPYLKSTLVTRGVDGEENDVPLFFDKNNKAKDGSYVTTQYLPISISKENLIAGNELLVMLNGIGENDVSATKLKSPELHIKYNSGNNSVDVSQVSGYAYDNLTDTKTGERYDLGISMINTFYVQGPIAQLPASVVLFSGNANGTIALSGTDNYYSNTMNGLEITMNATTTGGNVKYTAIGLPSTFKVPKEELIIGNKYYIPTTGMMEVADKLYDPTAMSQHYTPIAEDVGSHHYQRYFRGIKNAYFEIGTNSIIFNMSIILGDNVLNAWSDEEFKVEISKVTPY